MFELLASVLSGGMTGIIGSVVGGVFKFLDRREEAKAKAAEFQQEQALLRLQMEAGRAETENELAIAQAVTSREQLVSSYQHDMSTGTGYRWVAGVLRLVRPILTFALIGLTAAFYFTMESDAVIDGMQLKAYIINTMVYTTSAAVLWWFGDRAMQIKK